MLGYAIKWAIGAGVAVVATAGTALLLYNWDSLVLNVVAPWARKHDLQGVLNILVQVDRWLLGLRRVIVRFAGRKDEPLSASPVIVTERIVREGDLPPELRPVGVHQLTLKLES